MRTWVVGLGLFMALMMAAPQVGFAQTDREKKREKKKEKEKKEERKRKREAEEAAREYGARITGLLKSCSAGQLVVTVKSRKGEEKDVTLTLTEKTKVAGLKKDETLTDVPEGSKLTVAYTHKKDTPLNGTAVGVKVVKRNVEKAETAEEKTE